MKGLTTGEVAKVTGLSAPTVRRYIDEGYLVGFKLPKGYRRVKREDLLSFAKRDEEFYEMVCGNLRELENATR